MHGIIANVPASVSFTVPRGLTQFVHVKREIWLFGRGVAVGMWPHTCGLITPSEWFLACPQTKNRLFEKLELYRALVAQESSQSRRRLLLRTFFVTCKHLGTRKWIFNATFLYAFAARAESVAVLHSKHLTRSEFGPSKGHRVHKHHAYVIPLRLC